MNVSPHPVAPKRIVNGSTWTAYVLCYGTGPGEWFTMSTNLEVVNEAKARPQSHVDRFVSKGRKRWIEIWTFERTENGDRFVSRARLRYKSKAGGGS